MEPGTVLSLHDKATTRRRGLPHPLILGVAAVLIHFFLSGCTEKLGIEHYVDAVKAQKENDYRKAVEELRAYLAADDAKPVHVPFAWQRLGDCLEELGDYEGAEEAYEKVVELAPDTTVLSVGHARLRNLALKREDWPKALKHAQSLMEINEDSPDSSRYVVDLARLYWRSGDPERSEDLLRNTAAETDSASERGDCLLALAELISATGEAERRTTVCREILSATEIPEEHRKRAYGLIADTRYANGDTAGMEAAFAELRDAFPDAIESVRSYFAVAAVYRESDPEKAAACIEMATQGYYEAIRDSTLPDETRVLYSQMAEDLYQAQRIEDAIYVYEQLIDRFKEDTETVRSARRRIQQMNRRIGEKDFLKPRRVEDL
jgi:tetratricopeptide (TPR) repeat protein